MLNKFLFGIFLILSFGEAKINHIDDSENLQIPECIISLVEKYIDNPINKAVVIITIVPRAKIVQRKILQKFLDNSNYDMLVLTKDSDKFHYSPRHLRATATNYLIMLPNAGELHKTIKQYQSLPTYNVHAQWMVYFATHWNSTEVLNYEINSVFNELFSHGIMYVYILNQSVENPLKIQTVTWFPYTGTNCANKVDNIKLIDECQYLQGNFSIKSYNYELFPKISNNLHNCPITISAIVNEPYVYGSNKTTKRGTEYEMMLGITKHLKLKPTFRIPNESIALLKISDDKRFGLYADLLQKKSDIMIGGLYETNISKKLFWSTVNYYQDDFTWCVAKSKLSDKYMNVFIVFHIYLWLAMILITIILAIFLQIIMKTENVVKENLSWYFLITLSLSMSSYVKYWPKRISFRIFMMGLSLYGIVISSAYKSSLLKILQDPRYDVQVDNAVTAIEHGFTFTGGENVLDFLYDGNSVNELIKENFVPCYILDNCLMELKTNSKLAVAVSRKHASNTLLPLTDYDMFCFEKHNNIKTFPISMLTQKNYHLIPKLNFIIRQFAAAGMLTKWEKESARLVQNDNDLKAEEKLLPAVHEKLTLEHVQGAFYLLVIGFGISAIVFLIEVITHNYKRKTTLKALKVKNIKKPTKLKSSKTIAWSQFQKKR